MSNPSLWPEFSPDVEYTESTRSALCARWSGHRS